MLKSWQTSLAGILTLVGSLALTIAGKMGAETAISFEEGLIGMFAGLGLLFARDNDKSSEDVGTKGA